MNMTYAKSIRRVQELEAKLAQARQALQALHDAAENKLGQTAAGTTPYALAILQARKLLSQANQWRVTGACFTARDFETESEARTYAASLPQEWQPTVIKV